MSFLKKVFSNAGTIVKAAAITAAIVYTGGAAAAYIGGASMTAALAAGASMATTAFTMAVVSGAAAAGFADTPDIPADNALQNQQVTTRAPNENARIIYGTTRVGGNIVYINKGSSSKQLDMVIALAGHQIDSVSDFRENGVSQRLSINFGTTYSKSSKDEVVYRYAVYKGSASGNQPAYIKTTYNDYRFKGIAYLNIRLLYGDGDYWTSGIPKFTVKVTGKVPSGNAALCIKDFLQDTTYGLGVPASEIDTTSFATAEAVCDENVALKGGGTEKRYTVNAAFDSGETPQAILNKMLLACDGHLTYLGGKWTLNVGEYRAPTVEITEDDIVGAINVNTADSRRDTFNAVKGTYSEPTSNYNPQTYRPVENSLYESQDGEKIWKQIDFQCVTSNATCQRLAKIALEKARQQITVSLTCNLKAFKVKPSDTIQLTLDRYGWSQKEFEVIEWSANMGSQNPTVTLFLKETASGIWDWDSGEETELDLAIDTDLPDPLDVEAPGVTVTDELDTNAEGVITKLLINVTGDSFYSVKFEVQARISSSSTWVNVGYANGNDFELLNVKDGADYYVRARAINGLGVKSDWTQVTYQVVGKLANPSDVTGLAGNLIGNQYFLTWNAISDLDLSHYKIRYAPPDATAPTYRNSVDVVPKVPRPATSAMIPARNGTYFVKAVDKVGLSSLNAATIVLDSNIDGLNDLNVVQSINEHPDFTGTFDDTVFVDEEDRLILDTSLLFEDVTGDFDDAEGLFDAGFGNVDADGFYYFANSTDLGAIYTSRITASLKHVRVDYSLLFDSVDGLFDDREGEFDGDPDAFDDTNAELQIRTTGGDPSGSPTWSEWQPFIVGDYTFRGAEYRVKMTTTVNDATPAVYYLNVTVDMPDRMEAENDLVTSSGVKVVTFPVAFKATPSLGIAAQDMATGDYYEITSKSRSGFTITFRQSSGAVVATERTFDYVAKGYGRESA